VLPSGVSKEGKTKIKNEYSTVHPTTVYSKIQNLGFDAMIRQRRSSHIATVDVVAITSFPAVSEILGTIICASRFVYIGRRDLLVVRADGSMFSSNNVEKTDAARLS